MIPRGKPQPRTQQPGHPGNWRLRPKSEKGPAPTQPLSPVLLLGTCLCPCMQEQRLIWRMQPEPQQLEQGEANFMWNPVLYQCPAFPHRFTGGVPKQAAADLSSPAGAHHHGDVLLLRSCGPQWLRGLLQPTGRSHPLLHLQLPQLQGDILFGVCQSHGGKPGRHEKPLQCTTACPRPATCNQGRRPKTTVRATDLDVQSPLGCLSPSPASPKAYSGPSP